MTTKSKDPKRQLASTVTAVRKVLEKAGLYLPELEYQVEMLAADLLIYRKSVSDVLALEAFTIQENGITKAHPSVGLQVNAAAQLRKDLSTLLMNYQKKTGKLQPKTAKVQTEGVLEKLMSEVPR